MERGASYRLTLLTLIFFSVLIPFCWVVALVVSLIYECSQSMRNVLFSQVHIKREGRASWALSP